MKVLCTLFIVAAVALSCASCLSVSWGKRVPNDFLLLRLPVLHYPVPNKNWEVKVNYPQAGIDNKYTLSNIVVWDFFPNATGPQPTLWSGGPGYRFATVNLRSQISRGMNCTVEFYGK